MTRKNNIDTQKILKYLPYLVMAIIMFIDAVLLMIIFPVEIIKLGDAWINYQSVQQENQNLKNINEILTVQDQKSVEPYVIKARAALPGEKKTAGLITGLSSFAAKYGVAIKTLDFSPGLIATSSALTGYNMTNNQGEIDLKANVKALPVSFTADTDISSLTKFLNALKITSQMLGVTTISFTQGPINGNVSVGVLVYYQPTSFSKTSWGNTKKLSAIDIELLGSFPTEDVFKLPSM